MLDIWMVEHTVDRINEPMSKPERERLELIQEMERQRPSLRRRLAGRLVDLGLRLDPEALPAPLARVHA